MKCLTRHERATRWTQVTAQEVGSIPDEEQEMRVDVSTTAVRSIVASVREFRLGRGLARKNEHDGSDCRTWQTLAETCPCVQTLVALSSGDAEHYALIRGKLGNPVALPRLDGRQLSSKECGTKTWDWRTSQTLADTSLVAAEPSSFWSYEVARCCRRAKHCQVAAFASGQNMLERHGYSRSQQRTGKSKFEKYRMFTNDRTARIASGIAERQRSRGQAAKEARSGECWVAARWKSWCFLDSQAVESL